MIREMLNVLENVYSNQLKQSPLYRHVDTLQEGVKAKTYQSLMNRIKCSKFFIYNVIIDFILSQFSINFGFYR